MPTKKKKKELQNTVVAKPSSAKGTKRSPELLSWAGNRWHYFALFLIVLITFIAYLPVLHNGFVNWDDYDYIQNNPLIHAINFKDIFSAYVMGNYHPLTMLTYAIEYHFFALSEKGFHAVNLLFHLLNVILVFRVVFHLSDKIEVALIASLLFGIHPVHVESVAWASELKDLLYVFFFLAAYICYLRYIKGGQRKFYIYCLLLFLLSLLSKAMAVSLPVVLLLTDYYLKRFETIDLRQETKPQQLGLTSHVSRLTSVLIEKAPFFALSFIFGVVAIHAQQTSNTIHIDYFSFTQRIVFASYSFITYLVKLLLPFHIFVYYPYPIRYGTSIPVQYYTYLLIFLGLAAGVWNSLLFTKKILFGICFFAITIFIVLQLLPVGDALMADRYSYLPSVGIFYLAGEGFCWLWNKKWSPMRLKVPSMILLALATVFYSVKTYSQCCIWKNTLSLWNDVIRQDETIPFAYYNRGIYYSKEKKYEEALDDFTKAIELHANDADAYNKRGYIFKIEGKYEEALNDFDKAIALKPDFAVAYYNRGFIFDIEKRYPEALNDCNKVIQLQPDSAAAYNDRGFVFSDLKRYDEAINDFNKAIELQPDYAVAYYCRGIAEYNLGRKDNACADYQQAAKLGYQQAANTYNSFCH